MTKKIIIDDAVPYAKEMFSSLGDITCIAGKEIKTHHLKGADALIIRSRTNITPSLLENTPIKFVGSTVVGLDHVDLPYLKQQKIAFYSAQGCNANSVAEYVITCIVNYAEKNKISLQTKTLGIIGVGNVGKRLQQKALALGITVLANDPPRQEKEQLKEKTTSFVSLEKALGADIISFHTPLTNSGKHPTLSLLNKKNFHHINNNALLINAARGGIINESAWIKHAIKHKNITNIVDCWENEPTINLQLHSLADISTPHIAGHALEAKIKGSLMVYQMLCSFWQKKENHQWKKKQPLLPEIIKLPQNLTTQQAIHYLLKKCYQPITDHQAIDITNSTEFETYRRNYPIRREWSEYRVEMTNCRLLNQTIKWLGFQLI